MGRALPAFLQDIGAKSLGRLWRHKWVFLPDDDVDLEGMCSSTHICISSGQQ